MTISPPCFLFSPRMSKGFVPPGMAVSRNSTGYAMGPAGLLVQSSNNVMRLAYDPANVGNPQGILVEQSSINLELYSQLLSNAAWTVTRGSVPSTNNASPDGGTTASLLAEDSTATSTHYITQSLTASASTAYTWSVYAKAGLRSQIEMYLFDGAGNYTMAQFDLGLGTVISGPTTSGFTTTAANIQSIGNGWYRCWVTSTISSNTTLKQSIYLMSSGNLTYTGLGATYGVYIWGSQVEANLLPTSYVPTTSTSVTRAASTLLIPLSSIPGWNSAAGTLVVEGVTPIQAGAASSFYACIDDGTANNQIYVTQATNGSVYGSTRIGGSTSAQVNLGSVAQNTPFIVAFSWASGAFAASLNGATPVTSSSGSLPSGLTALRIGSGYSSNYANAPVSRVALYSRALTGSDLQAVSA